MKVIEKPWGRETILALNDYYCFKQIVIFAGASTSLQFHNEKEETNFVVSGSGFYHFKNNAGEMNKTAIGPGFYVTLKPTHIHRFEGSENEDLVMMEASSPQIWDVVRLEDSYGRKGTTDA